MTRSDRNKSDETVHSSDIVEAYLSVTDIKNYFYCPRIIYFEKVAHAQPLMGSQQSASKKTHENREKKETRRNAAMYYSPEFRNAEKIFRLYLESERLKLKGTLDLLIRDGQEYIPVEYKEMASDKGKIWLNHKYQLTAYALLIEEQYQTTVRRGFVDYLKEELVVSCPISEGLKKHTQRAITEINNIIAIEHLPPVTVPLSKCQGGCGYLWICQRK